MVTRSVLDSRSHAERGNELWWAIPTLRLSVTEKTIWHFTSQNETIYMLQYNSFKKTGVNNEFKNS